MLDIGVAIDHFRKLYQIKLHAWISEDQKTLSQFLEKDEKLIRDIDGILPPQRLQEILLTINQLYANGYTAVGTGTPYPEMIIPDDTAQMLEKWK